VAKWDEQSGLHYKQVPGFNLGVTSFAVIDKNKIAFLSDASNEIVIKSQSPDSILSRFPVLTAPRDFTYDNGNFYVLGESQVGVYDVTGKMVRSISYPASIVGVERITRYNNATYLLLPSGYSAEIESAGNVIQPLGHIGWITSSGNYVYTKISGNTYSVKVVTADGKVFEKSFTADKKVGGVYVVGSTTDRIVLDVQTFITESPIQVERHVVSIGFSTSGIGEIASTIKVPDCYYVLSNKELSVSADGSVTNMVSSPQGVYVFSLKETTNEKTQNYPDALLAVRYHFNDHLLTVDQK